MSLSKPRWTNETLLSVFQFLDRVNLHNNSLINHRFSLIVKNYFNDAPYDVTTKLEVIRGQWWIYIKSPHHFIKDHMCRAEIDPGKMAEFKELLQNKKYLRAKTTFIRIAEGHGHNSDDEDEDEDNLGPPVPFADTVKLLNFFPSVAHLWEGNVLSVRWDQWASSLYIPQCFSQCNSFSAHGLPIGLGLSFFLTTKCYQLKFTDNMRDPTIGFPVDQIIDWLFEPAEDGQQKSLHMYATGNSRIDWDAFLRNIRDRFLRDRRRCKVKFFCSHYNSRNTTDFTEENTHTNEQLIMGHEHNFSGLRNFTLTRVPVNDEALEE